MLLCNTDACWQVLSCLTTGHVCNNICFYLQSGHIGVVTCGFATCCDQNILHKQKSN